jgi:hypothetical protein
MRKLFENAGSFSAMELPFCFLIDPRLAFAHLRRAA